MSQIGWQMCGEQVQEAQMLLEEDVGSVHEVDGLASPFRLEGRG